MPIFLCEECIKKHVLKDEDAYYNLYCYHTYMDMKKKSIDKVTKKRSVKLEKQKTELPIDIMIDTK